MKDSSPTWRDLLRERIRDTKERQRLASEIGVNPMTLSRWANNETQPRIDEVRLLLTCVPDLRDPLLRDLLGGEVSSLPDIPKSKEVSVEEENKSFIPSKFYAAVLRATRDATPRFESVCNLVIPQILSQLDPFREGMEIIIASCMPPAEGQPVRSLRERFGQGTPPWKNAYLEEKYLFLGMESLAGYAIIQRHWIMVPNVYEQPTVLPLTPCPHEMSAAAFPIVLAGKVAGCLIASSAKPDYFTEDHLKVLDAYSDLVRFAFRDNEFYQPTDIDLGHMPHWEVQRSKFVTFRQRIAAVLAEARTTGQKIDETIADHLVRKQLEEELLACQRAHSQQNYNASGLLPLIW